jgi:2-haloacid dehalogenase
VFDLGGVLLGWEPTALFEPLLPPDVQVDQFLAETNFGFWNLEHDRGVPWQVAVASVRAAAPQHVEVFQRYPELFREALVGEIPGTRAVVADLRDARVRVLGLTNFGRGTFEVARQVYPWLADFEGIVVSSHEGVVKPEPAIYHVLLDRYTVAPQGAVFVDDRPENVAAAEDLGFTGLRFVDAAQLRTQLEVLGVL